MDFFRFGLFLNSSATDIVFVTPPKHGSETAIARCTSRWVMARGHRLNTSIVLAAVHGLSGLSRSVSSVEPSLFRPLPPLSPSPISILASVDVKQRGLFRITWGQKRSESALERRIARYKSHYQQPSSSSLLSSLSSSTVSDFVGCSWQQRQKTRTTQRSKSDSWEKE